MGGHRSGKQLFFKLDVFKLHFGKDPTSKYHCGNANMETGLIFVYFVFNKHLRGSCMQGIVPLTDPLFHLPGQPFHRDRLPGLQAQQVQNKTYLSPKTCSSSTRVSLSH